jgi:hypothetical protein
LFNPKLFQFSTLFQFLHRVIPSHLNNFPPFAAETLITYNRSTSEKTPKKQEGKIARSTVSAR